MIRYINNRFEGSGISFRIPDGYYYNSTTGEERPNKLTLHDPAEKYTLDIALCEETQSALGEITFIMDDMKLPLVTPITKIEINGLSGYDVTYQDRRYGYYEMWLDAPSAGACLNIIITIDGNIQEVETAAVVAAIDPRKA